MEERASVSYLCKSCNTLFFYESEVMAHKGMTGHQYFEKRGGERQNDFKKEILQQIEEMGISTKELHMLPEGALLDLLHSLKKAKSMTRKDS